MEDAIRADLTMIEGALRRIENEYFGGRMDPKFLVLLEVGEEFIEKMRKFLENYGG